MTSQAFERFCNEMEAARTRIGQTPEAVTRWLLRFAKDRTVWPAGDLLNAGYEMLQLGRYVAWDHLLRTSSFFPQEDYIGAPPPSPQTGARFVNVVGKVLLPIPGEEAIREFHEHVRILVNKIVKREHFQIEVPALNLDLWPLEFPIWTLSAYEPVQPKEWEAATAVLLIRFVSRIRRCRECQELFLAERLNQRYCSAKCQTKAGTQRFREAHPELRTGRPRGRPPKQKARPSTMPKQRPNGLAERKKKLTSEKKGGKHGTKR